VKKWTSEDEAACKIQKHVRQFLAKQQLARKKKEHADYEELMDKLEKEVFRCLQYYINDFAIVSTYVGFCTNVVFQLEEGKETVQFAPVRRTLTSFP